uniref:Uncharacterized protein n=1 Tax=Acrobeloides nanus TaxID=290746 RepID=A0A914D3I7_9BILA
MMMTFHHLVPSALLELLGGFWCVTNGPFAYLWFNSELRADFLDIYFGLKKTTKRIYYKVSSIPGLRRRTNAVRAAQNEDGIKRTADIGSDLTKPGMQASSQNATNMANTIQNLQTDTMDNVRENIDCD